MTADPPIDTRELNRALLARQHLLDRADVPVLAMVDHLVGLQAQNAWSPYVGLWSRLSSFRHADLGETLLDRTAARIAVMRGTIHLVTAADALLLPELVAPLYRKDLLVNAAHAAGLRTLDIGELSARARTLVEAEPRRTTELGALLRERWPDVAPATLAHGARGTLPLVQVPPRGVWGRSGATTWTTAWSWFGPDATAASPDVTDPDVLAVELERVVVRYLTAFGPATVADVQTWSGLTGLRAVVDRLGDRLVRFSAPPAPGGVRPRTVLDVPAGPRPGGDVPAPVRFLPDFDNVLLGHADRSRLVSDERRRSLQSSNGVIPGTVLVDGRVGATWSVRRTRLDAAGRARRELATLEVTPLDPVSRTQRRELDDEGARFVRFFADDAAEHDVLVR
ncbi:winged helix DNA-binding domain-containing protein [Cellulomonas sp. URHB0016]